MTNLFQQGKFKLHSGIESDIKIDCDYLTLEDFETIAYVIAKKMEFKFSEVEGVPTGGLALAQALEKYQNSAHDRLLIVDDVLTTGNSMEDHRAGRDAIGVVIFARSIPPYWVTPVFMMAGGV